MYDFTIHLVDSYGKSIGIPYHTSPSEWAAHHFTDLLRAPSRLKASRRSVSEQLQPW